MVRTLEIAPKQLSSCDCCLIRYIRWKLLPNSQACCFLGSVILYGTYTGNCTQTVVFLGVLFYMVHTLEIAPKQLFCWECCLIWYIHWKLLPNSCLPGSVVLHGTYTRNCSQTVRPVVFLGVLFYMVHTLGIASKQ